MIVIITSSGDSPDSKFDLRFGRAAWLCVYNTETGTMEFIENENKFISGGAGTKTAAKVAELGAQKVISGDFGPKAKMMLEKLKIQMITLDGDGNRKIEEIINNIKNV
jgi:predicted Fe-Mo cluster-binding NifX family protein